MSGYELQHSRVSSVKQPKIELENDIAAFDLAQLYPLLDRSARILTVSHYVDHSDLGAAKEFCVNDMRRVSVPVRD